MIEHTRLFGQRLDDFDGRRQREGEILVVVHLGDARRGQTFDLI
ncbi:MAG TPA: hypothetical protein VGF48_26825 [Thermoanaerobaculia bacterium]